MEANVKKAVLTLQYLQVNSPVNVLQDMKDQTAKLKSMNAILNLANIILRVSMV